MNAIVENMEHVGDFGKIRGLRRAEYDRLVAAGVFEGQKIELLRGQLVEMSPQYEEHADAVMLLTELLIVALAGKAWVRPQLPWAASEDSEPEPDLAVIARDFDRSQHPSQALLLIEVANSSLAKDQRLKRDIYAEAGVPEYWVVDVNEPCVYVYREPANGVFATCTRYGRGEVITPVAIASLTVAVDDIFGPASSR